MKVTNQSGQTLVFPNTESVVNGGKYTLTDKDMKNAAVTSWIDQGWLVEAKEKAKEKA